MSDHQFERAVNDWLEDGTDRTPERAIDGVLLAVKTTPQERDLRIPWRFPQMLALPRASGIAAVAIVAVVGAGGLIFLNNRAPTGAGGAPTTPPATEAPTVAPTPEPSYPGITGWVPYTSELYGYTMSYPEGWEASPAEGDPQPDDPSAAPPMDVFGSPVANDLAVMVYQVPAGTGADVESLEGLKAWAEAFCNDSGGSDPNVGSGCDTIKDRAEPICVATVVDACRTAVLVRSEGNKDPGDVGEWVIFPTEALDEVYVVGAGRGDAWPGAAKYGGSVQLLKSILAEGVTEAP